MKVLVTAGRTLAMIDQVRTLENIFRGRTGTDIACTFSSLGHEVTLLTSEPGLVSLGGTRPLHCVRAFRTFDDLEAQMRLEISEEPYDLIIHSAAVSDYKFIGGLFTRDADGSCEDEVLVTRIPTRGKIPSGCGRLLIELEPTIKLIDLIRGPLGFTGNLVKFKLQVDNAAGEPMSDDELIEIAQRSREHSDADLIVANCLAWARDRAIVLGRDGAPEHVSRRDIATAIHRRVT